VYQSTPNRRHDGCDGLAVVAYADSDFANDKVSGKLVYGYISGAPDN
jgi:hypothetical protein